MRLLIFFGASYHFRETEANKLSCALREYVDWAIFFTFQVAL